MKKKAKWLALALGALFTVTMFAGCGKSGGGDNGETPGNQTPGDQTPGDQTPGNQTPETPVTGDGVFARICYDNLGGAKSYLSAADTKITVKGATDITGYGASGSKVSDYKTIATYDEATGEFTAVSAGSVSYKLGNKVYRIEVVPAYATDPGNQFTGKPSDTNLTTGATYLGNTHDPSFIEVTSSTNGLTSYYLFSTGWGTGNDVHVSYDGMLTWEYVGKATQSKDYSNESIFPAPLKEWMNSTNNSGDLQWWAPDIVEAKDGGYWFYTCLVMADSRMPQLTSSKGNSFAPTCKYSRACIVMYHIADLGKIGETGAVEYKGVLMQSAIPQDGSGAIDVNGIDPQIIYDTEGKMYMAFGSFGTGNWMVELNPETGLRKDGDNEFHDWEWIRQQRNFVVTGDENVRNISGGAKNTVAGKKLLSGEKYEHPYYGTMISVGNMEAPIIARHDDVVVADETGTYDEATGKAVGEGKTYYYSMHSYNGLADDYQMWGGRSESVWGLYRSTGGGYVYNINYGQAGNQGNKYMGGFAWRDESKVDGCNEYASCLTGHNDLYTTKNGVNLAAYINRLYDNTGKFMVQVHSYYLNSKGDICINPNRYAKEIDRSVSKEELFACTDNGRFEMVVLTNGKDWNKNVGLSNVSFEVVMKEDGTITRANEKIGTWIMYGRGYIKFTFDETLKGTGLYDSGETVYYGVVRPAWLYNRNQSGFTISCLGYSGEKGQSMAMFMNAYSTIGA